MKKSILIEIFFIFVYVLLIFTSEACLAFVLVQREKPKQKVFSGGKSVMLKTVLWLLLLITLVTAVTTSAQETVCIPDPATVLATLRKEHPRLLINDSDLARLKSLRKTDKILQKCIEDVLKTADVYCTNPTLSYKEEEGH